MQRVIVSPRSAMSEDRTLGFCLLSWLLAFLSLVSAGANQAQHTYLCVIVCFVIVLCIKVVYCQ